MPASPARRTRPVLAVAALAAALVARPADAQFGTNLIVNPGGEAQVADGSPGGTPDVIVGWTTAQTFSLIAYGQAGGSYPDATTPGPADRGANFFGGGGGPGSPGFSTATQVLDLSTYAGLSALVDGGTVQFDLSAWLGGYGIPRDPQNDRMSFAADFLDGANASVGSVVLGPVTSADRNNTTALLFRSLAGTLPVGTRNVRFTMTAIRETGSSIDGFADNLGFRLSVAPQAVVPEPGTWALMAAGLAGLAGVARRRARA